VTSEKLELLTDNGDFTTLFCVILRREWLESSIESGLICNIYGAFHDFAF